MTQFDTKNKDRKRYFGIRVGDKVRTTFPNGNTWEGIVQTLCSPDESHIEVKFIQGSGGLSRIPADLFQIVKTVEDLNEKWI